DCRTCLRRCTRQADVGAVDPERVHEMEEPLLDLERRVPDRRALQAVAERLVVELDRAVVGARGAAIAIPVVDQLVELGLHATYGASAARAIGRGRITRTHHATRSATSPAVCPSATSATTISLRARSAKGSRIEAICVPNPPSPPKPPPPRITPGPPPRPKPATPAPTESGAPRIACRLTAFSSPTMT